MLATVAARKPVAKMTSEAIDIGNRSHETYRKYVRITD
jgi:hypothetical protein